MRTLTDRVLLIVAVVWPKFFLEEIGESVGDQIRKELKESVEGTRLKTFLEEDIDRNSGRISFREDNAGNPVKPWKSHREHRRRLELLAWYVVAQRAFNELAAGEREFVFDPSSGQLADIDAESLAWVSKHAFSDPGPSRDQVRAFVLSVRHLLTRDEHYLAGIWTPSSFILGVATPGAMAAVLASPIPTAPLKTARRRLREPGTSHDLAA